MQETKLGRPVALAPLSWTVSCERDKVGMKRGQQPRLTCTRVADKSHPGLLVAGLSGFSGDKVSGYRLLQGQGLGTNPSRDRCYL